MRISSSSAELFLFLLYVIQLVETKNIIILAGQSNMVGWGRVDQYVEERRPNPMILRFSANRTWEIAADPLHGDIDLAPNTTKGVGPGMPFAKSVLKRDPDFGVIGLVPCAIGDPSLSQWEKGSELYNNMLARAQAAAAAGGGGVIRGMLWYQGESDTALPAAAVYKTKFQKFISDVRSDLELPYLPIIEVAVTYATDNASYAVDLVRRAQLETAVELEKVSCVDAKGLEIISNDSVHLTTPAQVRLGAMMADAFLLQIGYGFVKESSITPSPNK